MDISAHIMSAAVSTVQRRANRPSSASQRISFRLPLSQLPCAVTAG
jgi:hypothetical protein